MRTSFRRSPAGQLRPAAAVVEMAAVLVVFFTLLMGVIEYTRFLFVYNLAQSSARDAARFLVVKTNGGSMPGDPAAAPTPEEARLLVTSGTFAGRPVCSGMGGLERNIENLEVSVFIADPAGLNLTPPVVRPLQVNQANAPWSSAGFGQRIGVRLSGAYRPVAPGLLFLPSTIPFQVTVLVSSEGN